MPRYFTVASGNIGSEKRRNPYVPIFNSTPASMTEPAVGASVCASGNHVWNGNIGTLIANAKKNPQKSHFCSQRVGGVDMGTDSHGGEPSAHPRRNWPGRTAPKRG